MAERKEREERQAALDEAAPDTPQLTLAPIHIDSGAGDLCAQRPSVSPSVLRETTSSSSCVPSAPETTEAVARSPPALVHCDSLVCSHVDSAVTATSTTTATTSQESQYQSLSQTLSDLSPECAAPTTTAVSAPTLQHWGCATAAQLHSTNVDPPHSLARMNRTAGSSGSSHGAELQRALQLLRHNQERRELDTLWQLASMAAASVLRSLPQNTRTVLESVLVQYLLRTLLVLNLYEYTVLYTCTVPYEYDIYRPVGCEYCVRILRVHFVST